LAPLAPPLEADALAEEGPAPGFGCSFTIVPTAAPKPAPLPKPTMFEGSYYTNERSVSYMYDSRPKTEKPCSSVRAVSNLNLNF
jgi:hypothetical protein